MPNLFCQTCTSILSLRSLPLEDFDPLGCHLLTTSCHSFDDGARRGCKLCLLFISVFGEKKMVEIRYHNSENQLLPKGEMYETTFTLYSYGNSQLLLEVSYSRQGEGTPQKKRKSVMRPAHSGIMFLSPDCCKPDPALFSLAAGTKNIDVKGTEILLGPKANTGSETSLNLAKLWLNECKGHPACQKESLGGSTPFAVPTRLLQVGSSTTPNLRLCQVPDGTSYASLSHCWGAHVPVKLLYSNLASFQDQIEIAELPKTFQEAIDVARRLDIEYIWIDSLCIIQDSKEDWANEAAFMHQVYSNAIVNIAADDAKDGTEGLFRNRDQRLCEPCEVEVEWTKQHCATYVAVDNSLWQSSMETSVLNSRAWVLQEQLLSPRILHFGRTQLLWECQSGKACELFPAGLYEGHTGYGPKKTIKKAEAEGPFILEHGGDSNDERVVVEFSQHYEAHLQWKDIVDNYTNRQLTFGSDKLVAISALARHFQKANLDSEYLAGLWRKDLAAQLLWSTARLQLNSRPTTRQTEYRAPTWSWASVDGRILPGTPGLNQKPGSIQIKIHEVKMKLVSKDPFGSVSSGHIVISGRIARVSLSTAGSAANKAEGTSSYNLQVCAGTSALIPKGRLGGSLQLALKDCTYENGSIASSVYDDIYFIPVSDEHDGGRRGNLGSAGILLQREGLAASFRRFGMYHCHIEDMSLFEKGFEFFDSMAGDAGLEFYEDEVSHKNMYKISIL